jgi:hypothetical protein
MSVGQGVSIQMESVADINRAMPLRKIRDLLDRTDLSADAKALLLDIANLTVTVGQFVLNIGRKIISVAFEIIQKFPKITFGVVISFIVVALVSAVPVVGAVMAAFTGPLLVACGLTIGALGDMKDASWTKPVTSLEEQLLKATA